MFKNIKLIPTKMANNTERYSKTVTKNGVTKTIEVEKVENGFIISINKYGQMDGGEYIDDCKKYIAKENPLEKKEELPQQEEANILDSLSSMFGEEY